MHSPHSWRQHGPHSFSRRSAGHNAVALPLHLQFHADDIKPLIIDVWLSDRADGLGLIAKPVAAVAVTEGALYAEVVPGKAWRVQVPPSGIVELTVTDSGRPSFYPVAQLVHGHLIADRHITSADYGA